MNLEAAVADLIQACPGVTAAALVDPDGIPVAMEPQERMLEEVAAQFAAVLHEVNQAERELNHGPLHQLAVHGEDATLLLTTVSAGYFLVLQLDRRALVGKARFVSRLAAERLHSEFI